LGPQSGMGVSSLLSRYTIDPWLYCNALNLDGFGFSFF
jgi:hypothetical protein